MLLFTCLCPNVIVYLCVYYLCYLWGMWSIESGQINDILIIFLALHMFVCVKHILGNESGFLITCRMSVCVCVCVCVLCYTAQSPAP